MFSRFSAPNRQLNALAERDAELDVQQPAFRPSSLSQYAFTSGGLNGLNWDASVTPNDGSRAAHRLDAGIERGADGLQLIGLPVARTPTEMAVRWAAVTFGRAE